MSQTPNPTQNGARTTPSDAAADAISQSEDSPSPDKNQMWGGRFSVAPSEIMTRINASIDVDQRLWRQDIAGSLAHAAMLGACGILTQDDVAAIADGLDRIAGEIEAGTFPFSAALEDIHMNIEARLRELVGEPAARLHTARSRNDQVATDFRLWMRGACDEIADALTDLQDALTEKAVAHAASPMPGYTHLQSAQPVTFGHHCLAYVEMFERDRGRILDAQDRMNECPLGAAALAGTSFPIDREMTARALGFRAPMANSLDAVSARDFVLETLSAASITALHISRLAEEIVLWTSPHFGFVTLSDAFSTGSSIMPQKRNPDAAELCRAKAGSILSAFQALGIVMKGLPLAYSKDMQEDKAGTFNAIDDLLLALGAMAGMVRDLTVNEAAMARATNAGHATATDLADWLVRAAGLPFREAHHVTGRIVAAADAAGVHLSNVPIETMQEIDARITDDVYSVLSVEASLASRQSYGGTAPDRVSAMAAEWQDFLAERRGQTGNHEMPS